MLGSIKIKGIMTSTPENMKQIQNKKVTVFIFYEDNKSKDFLKITYTDENGKDVLIKIPHYKWHETKGDNVKIVVKSGVYKLSLR